MSRFPRIYYRRATRVLERLLHPPVVANAGSDQRLPREWLAPLEFQSGLPGFDSPEVLQSYQSIARFGTVHVARSASADLSAGLEHVRLRELPAEDVFTLEARGGPALLPAGLVVSGGLQDRVVATPTLVQGKASVPVFCVEQGRWEGERDFTAFGRLPGVVEYQLQSILAGNAGADVQEQLWSLVRELLVLEDRLNPTLRTLPIRNMNHSSQADAASGFFVFDRRVGLASLCFEDPQLVGGDALGDLHLELSSRLRLTRLALGAREFYRIYEEKSGLAIRCHENGQAMHDGQGRPIVFHYSPADLEFSFQPPIETPPAIEADRTLGERANFDSPEELLELLCESTVTFGAQPSAGLVGFTYGHPERPLLGQGVLMQAAPRARARLVALSAHMIQDTATASL